MFKTSQTIISKPKSKCFQLVELHKVDDYLGPRFSSVFSLFSTLLTMRRSTACKGL